jgi:hypothetical protein
LQKEKSGEVKRLIAVPTCHQYVYPKRDEGAAHQSGDHESRSLAVRNTWYRIWEEKYKDQIDVKFFFGRWPQEATRTPLPDEVFLDVEDDYYHLPIKVQKTFQWALDTDYDFVLKQDDDVFNYVDRLLKNFEPSDYRGWVNGDYVSGAAYWISRKSMEFVTSTQWNPKDWAEDKWVGSVLRNNGVIPVHDERFQCCHCDVCLEKYPESTRITSHTTRPERMYELYKHLRASV